MEVATMAMSLIYLTCLYFWLGNLLAGGVGAIRLAGMAGATSASRLAGSKTAPTGLVKRNIRFARGPPPFDVFSCLGNLVVILPDCLNSHANATIRCVAFTYQPDKAYISFV